MALVRAPSLTEHKKGEKNKHHRDIFNKNIIIIMIYNNINNHHKKY